MHLFSSFFLHILAFFTKIRPNLSFQLCFLLSTIVKIGWRVKKGVKFIQLKTSSLDFVKLLIFYMWNVKWLFFLSWSVIRNPPPPFITLFLVKQCQVDTINLDFEKSFDKVSHEPLLVKLRYFGIGGSLLRWFGDYLSGRDQRVSVLGVTSEPLPVLSVVLTKSILAPLLFLGYVNDLPPSTSNDTIVECSLTTPNVTVLFKILMATRF